MRPRTGTKISAMLVLAGCLVGPKVAADVHYVDGGNATPVSPYTNWQTAATSVRDATDQAADGDVVVVTNGHYVLPRVLLLDKAITLVSVNGAPHTTLDADGKFMSMLMTHEDALVEGFTIVRGFGWTANYVFGTMKKCIVRDCHAESINAVSGAVYLGGNGRLENCLIYNNTARCVPANLGALGSAGVRSAGGDLVNCTITANTLIDCGGGGGLQTALNGGQVIARNCIIWGNSSPSGNDVETAIPSPYLTHCCMPRYIHFSDNLVDSPPQFRNAASGDFRLQSGSPCIDAGAEEPWMLTDTGLGGEPRIWDGDGDNAGAPDIGAYEFVPTGTEPLHIVGTPAEYGVPGPLGYGYHNVSTGTTITNSVNRLVEETNGVAYVCMGWRGTGDAPSSGEGTSVVFTITQHSTIEWLWEQALFAPADYGDAPSPYFAATPEGAWHVALGPTLGASRDAETNGQATANADGDDVNPSGGPDDEDGAVFGSPVRVGQHGAIVTVNVQNVGAAAQLDAWIDLNGDGAWGGPFERIAGRLPVTNGDNVIRFDVPGDVASGVTYARFRLTTDADLGPNGFALDGEVEDYRIELMPPTLAAGRFSPRHAIGNAAYSVSAADLDGDGDTDVFGAMEHDEIAWFENNGSQDFTRRTIADDNSGIAMSVIAVDVDGDERLDVVSAHGSGIGGVGRIVWHRNEGGENFSQHVVSLRPWGADNVFAADVDLDGDIDLCSASSADGAIAWHENDGDQGFTDHVISSAADGATSVFAADVDSDGDMDLLSASPNDNTVAWYENDGNQGFGIRLLTEFAIGATSVLAADLDGDGDMDVVSAAAGDDKIRWHENDGNQSFAEHIVASGDSRAHALSAADVDGDGDLDLVSAGKVGFFEPGTDTIAWYENEAGNFIEHRIAADGAYSLCVADVDRDGDLDLLGAWRQGINVGHIGWYENELALDFGDLPAAYNLTTLGDDGAHHKILHLRLGSTVDDEPDGQESEDAGRSMGDGDDGDDGDDEDGILVVETWVDGAGGGKLLVEVSRGPGYLSGWVDWNSDDDLVDPGEQILNMHAVTSGVQAVSFDIPTGAMAAGGDHRFARFRLGPDASPPLVLTGLVVNGEVEDYQLPLGGPPVVELEIVSAHGVAHPAAGRHVHVSGESLQASVSSPDVHWPTQYLCTGWAMVGNAPATGTNTVMSMTLANDAALHWQWKTQVWVSVSSAAGGSVAPLHAWRDPGSVVDATAIPSPASVFSHWSDVPAAAATNNPLRIAVDRSRRIVAHFVSTDQAATPTHFVDVNSATPVPPYTNWQTAATVIQDAIDVCDSNDVVLVAAGAYAVGGRAVYGELTNRVALTKAVTVTAVDGPEVTRIVGRGPKGDGAVRCAYVGSGARLEGFTLTNGHTRTSGDYFKEECGGGVWCEASGIVVGAIITDCSASGRGGGVSFGAVFDSIIRSNSAGLLGGGGYECSVTDCLVEGNRAGGGGGLYDSTALRCRLSGNAATSSDSRFYYGGGAFTGVLERCIIEKNTATRGSGVARATVRNCLVIGNGDSHSGGGVYEGVAENCTIADNAATFGSGTYDAIVRNCIVWQECRDGEVSYSCYASARDITSGPGNISVDPRFVAPADNDFRLLAQSPCIDSGTDLSGQGLTNDLEGVLRPQDGRDDGAAEYDMGAYEYFFPYVELEILAGPAEHGSPFPLGYGVHQVLAGSIVTNTVYSPADESNGTRYACSGWTGAGSAPATGSATSLTFTVTNNSMLTWQWQTEHLLTLVSPSGSISGAASGYKTEGFIYDLTASADFGYQFDHWTANGVNAGTSQPLKVTMIGPTTAQAVFATAFVDVTDQVDSPVVDFSLNRQTGTFFGTLELHNKATSSKPLLAPFWYVVEATAELRLVHPTGVEPVSGFPYIDVTDAVQAALPDVGNGDNVLDPGETVRVSGIEFYSLDRTVPEGYLFAVWADPPGDGAPSTAAWDTDLDGIPNGWEDAHSPLNKHDPLDGALDSDRDGMSNLAEYRTDTDPSDPNSSLRLIAVDSSDGALRLRWQGGVSATQVLCGSDDLVGWTDLYTNAPPTGVTNHYEVDGRKRVRFYRLRIEGR